MTPDTTRLTDNTGQSERQKNIMRRARPRAYFLIPIFRGGYIGNNRLIYKYIYIAWRQLAEGVHRLNTKI